MSSLEEHPHIIRLKQVLYGPHRLYLVTGTTSYACADSMLCNQLQ